MATGRRSPAGTVLGNTVGCRAASGIEPVTSVFGAVGWVLKAGALSKGGEFCVVAPKSSGMAALLVLDVVSGAMSAVLPGSFGGASGLTARLTGAVVSDAAGSVLPVVSSAVVAAVLMLSVLPNSK